MTLNTLYFLNNEISSFSFFRFESASVVSYTTFRWFNTNCPCDLSVTGKLCVNAVSEFIFFCSLYLLQLFVKGVQKHFFHVSPFLTSLTLQYAIESFLLQKFQHYSRQR